jgi:hypothetical protein
MYKQDVGGIAVLIGPTIAKKPGDTQLAGYLPFLRGNTMNCVYRFRKHIRIRSCDELSFFVNISNNSLYMIKTDTLNFLQTKLEEGLSADTLDSNEKRNKNFVEFIDKLIKQDVLEVTSNEI